MPSAEHDPSPSPTPPPKRSAAPWVVFGLFAGIALVILAATYAVKTVAVDPATSFTGKVAAALSHLTQSEVKITSNTVTIEQSDITELAVVSRQVQTIVKYESGFLGSNNILILKGDFTVKAGFDLAHPFVVETDPATGSLTADFPPAKILSIEMDNYHVYHAQSGLWNKLKPDDQELVTRQLLIQARVDAEKSDLKQEAERKLLTRLNDLVSDPTTFTLENPTALPPADPQL